MGIVQKDAFRTMLLSYVGLFLGYLNKGFLFVIVLNEIQLGLVNLIVTLGLLLAQMASFGTVISAWKFVPFFKNKEKKHHGFFPLLFIAVLLGVGFWSILTIVFKGTISNQYIERSPVFVDYYYLILPIGIGYVFYLMFDSYLKGFYKNIVSVFAIEIVLRVAILISIIALWLKWISFDVFIVLHSFIYVLPAFILVIYLKRIGELNLDFSSINISKRFRKIIIQFSAYNYINSLGAILVQSLDVLLIAKLLGLEATGVYATVVFLASALQVPYKSIVRISSPLVSEYWKNRQKDKMQELYVQVSSASLFIGLVSFAFVWMNIDFIFNLPFLGPEFHEGKWVFFFLMMGRLLDMFFGINGTIFSTSKKYKYDLIFTLILIGLVYILNLWFIPIWGIAGAAISTSIAVAFYNVGRMLFVWNVYKLHPFIANQFKVIGLALFTLFTWSQIAPLIQNEWLKVALTGFYLLIVFILPVFVFGWEKESKNYFIKVARMLGVNFS